MFFILVGFMRLVGNSHSTKYSQIWISKFAWPYICFIRIHIIFRWWVILFPCCLWNGREQVLHNRKWLHGNLGCAFAGFQHGFLNRMLWSAYDALSLCLLCMQEIDNGDGKNDFGWICCTWLLIYFNSLQLTVCSESL